MNLRVPLIRLSWVVSICLALAFSTVALAQVTTGRLEGYVKDPAGLVIPGVPVTATNEANNITTETLSNETGLYVFAQLTPGTYTLTAELSGFKRFVLTGIIIQVGDTKHETVDLETGEISETVQVSAQIESVDGLRYEQNNLQIEGVSNDTAFLTTGASRSMAPVPIESVGEYRVVTSSASAEFGRGSGAQVSIVYKSGTNEFHGSAGFWSAALRRRFFLALAKSRLTKQSGAGSPHSIIHPLGLASL